MSSIEFQTDSTTTSTVPSPALLNKELARWLPGAERIRLRIICSTSLRHSSSMAAWIQKVQVRRIWLMYMVLVAVIDRMI